MISRRFAVISRRFAVKFDAVRRLRGETPESRGDPPRSMEMEGAENVNAQLAGNGECPPHIMDACSFVFHAEMCPPAVRLLGAAGFIVFMAESFRRNALKFQAKRLEVPGETPRSEGETPRSGSVSSCLEDEPWTHPDSRVGVPKTHLTSAEGAACWRGCPGLRQRCIAECYDALRPHCWLCLLQFLLAHSEGNGGSVCLSGYLSLHLPFCFCD